MRVQCGLYTCINNKRSNENHLRVYICTQRVASVGFSARNGFLPGLGVAETLNDVLFARVQNQYDNAKTYCHYDVSRLVVAAVIAL